jgi:hypothetical protein
MANVIHRTDRDSNGALLRAYSVNTPDYSTSTWVINPDLSGVVGVPEYYWKVSGDNVVEMNNGEKNQIDATRLASAKTKRSAHLNDRAGYLLEMRYNGLRDLYLGMYTDAQKLKPKKAKEIQKWVDWINLIAGNLNTKTNDVHKANTVDDVNAVSIDESTLLDQDPGLGITGVEGQVDDGTLGTFLNANAVVTDPYTDVSGPFYLMQLLDYRRDLYNDSENPLYLPGHTPILGTTGMLQVVTNRVANVENIHAKVGWHEQEVRKALYRKPSTLLIYYGYPNSFNSLINGWDNEKVAQDMARYSLIVLGDGVQIPTHPDYANTQVIIPRVKALNPSALIFGYVVNNQTLANFQTKAAQWETLQVHGIFMDECGYDYGRTRADFNSKVDYVHGLAHASLCFANSWNSIHILSTENDPSYPNTTYNASLAESHLTLNDWMLLESFPVNTLSFAGSGGYESSLSWAYRGAKAVFLRATYGVNFAGIGVINNDNSSGQTYFNLGYISAGMWSLDAYGTSDIYYGAGTAQVKFWTRPSVSEVGNLWSQNASVSQDKGDTGIYHRYLDYGRLSLGWVASGETGAITIW